MDSSADLLISVALILLSARLSAQAASRFGLPSVFGLLVAGVLLGPSATDLIELSEPLDAMSHLGVVILLFVAGVETDLIELRKVGRAALFAAIGGVALPMAGGTGLALVFGYDVAEAVFVGTILTATSVTVSAHVLRELGHLQSRVGSAILGAAIIDDIIGVMVLTVVISLEGEGSALDLVRLAAFIPAALVIGYWLIRFASSRLERVEEREHRFIEVLALVLAFAWAAQEIGGLAAITGAYLAGVFFGRTLLRDDLADFGNLIGYALFAPIFFVTTGMTVDLDSLASEPLFVILLTLVAIVAKTLGSLGGALAGGFKGRESLAVGCGMVARGEVALVIAVLGFDTGVIDAELFAASTAMTLLSTLAAPLMLRLALPRGPEQPPASLDHRTQLAAQIERLDA